MAHQILDVLSEKVPLTITPALAKAIIHYVTAYETYGTNINAFTSPYLGLYPCVFRAADREGFFELFHTDEGRLSKFIASYTENNKNRMFGIETRALVSMNLPFIRAFSSKLLTLGFTSADMRKVTQDISTIDNDFKVASDPFNIFCVWATHRVLNAKLDNRLKYDTAAAILKLLQYKFFTSLVNWRFKFKPNEQLMQTTYESLSDRYDIKQYGTWKGLMDARIQTFLAPNSIHYKTLHEFHDDKAILYVITDIQSRIRAQINAFYEEYMRVKDSDDIIGSYSSVGTDNEGEKVLLDNEEGIDMAISSVYQDTMSITRFLDDKAIRLVVSLFTALRMDQFRQFLIAYSEKITKLAKAKKDDEVSETNDGEIYIGGHILVQQIIQQTYRYCQNTNVNTKIPSEIIKTAKGVYSASRVLEQDIVNIRNSVDALVLELQKSRRETTVSAIKVAFILYIVVLSLKYL